jgi:hypothetical protein
MPSSSSTSNSEARTSAADGRGFSQRILAFSAPYQIGLLIALLEGATSGELFPARFAAWLQTFNRPVLYLPKFSDHTFAYKVEAAKLNTPEILVLGPSRANQWRSAMFKGRFYNAANSTYTFAHDKRFLEELGPAVPKVLILSIDFYMFNEAWDEVFRTVSLTDIDPLNLAEVAPVAAKLAQELAADPRSILRFQRDGLYHVPAIGLSAGLQKMGFRLDGSFQYGPEITGDYSKTFSIEQARVRMSQSAPPFQHGGALAQVKLDELAAVLSMAKSKGISVIGITMPYDPRIVAALNVSPQYGIWRDFRSQEFRGWMKKQGVLYFDFSDIDSFGGRANEFIDPVHPSETAYLRILLKMAEDESARRLLPIDQKALLERLAHSTPLEVFRNEF